NTGSGAWGSSYARGSTYFQGVSWTNGIVNYASDCLRLSEGGTDSHFGGSSTHQSHIDINITFIIDSQNPRRMTPPKGLYISGRAFNINFQYPSSSTFCAPSTWPQLVLSGSGPGPVVYYSHTAFDLGGDARGDADGRPESGERIELAVTLINQGNATAEGVVGILSTSDPDVTIQDYFNTWADIPGGATQDNLGNFVFDIKSNLAQDKTVTFTLTVSANGTGEMISTFEVPIYVQNQVQINAPGNLAATVQNNNTVQLTWQDNSDNEEGFKIERQIGSGNWNEIATTGANIKSYTDTGLTGGQAYSYRVRTYLLLANSDYSNEASVTLPLVIFTEISTSLPGTDFSAATWGDYDNDDDLDILLAGRGDSGSIAKVYRNDGGAFTDIAAPLAVVSDGADRWMEWGDYDNDGDLDILLTGSGLQGPTSKIYRNDNGNFVDLNAGLTGVYHSSVAWGDYDNDGDLDVLLTGWDGGDRIAKIYRNDAGKFLNISAPLTPVDFSSVAWGDYDNDGDLDILLTGTPDGASGLTKIYRNDHGNFVDIAAPLVGVSGSSVAWGDYDNDGD
ncbi:MAG: FG-GAP-like repeat-containing protein, partial [bacterium]